MCARACCVSRVFAARARASLRAGMVSLPAHAGTRLRDGASSQWVAGVEHSQWLERQDIFETYLESILR